MRYAIRDLTDMCAQLTRELCLGSHVEEECKVFNTMTRYLGSSVKLENVCH